MYNESRAITALYQRLGWTQPTRSGSVTLDTANKTTNSGMLFEDGHKLVTVQNIVASMEDEAADATVVNAYLVKLQKAMFNKMLRAVFRENDLIENKVLYPYANVWDNPLANDTNFVGYEIDVSKTSDVCVRLNSITLDFDATGTVTIYLYHSSQKTALQSKSCTVTANTSVTTALNWDLEAMRYQGGKFYIGYNRTGLTPKAMNRQWDWANEINRFSHARFTPFMVVPNGTSLFDIDDIDYEADTYGMNFDVSSLKDFTVKIEKNPAVFDTAQQLQMAAEVLELIYSSTRSNGIERAVKDIAFQELNRVPNDENPFAFSIMSRLNKELDKVRNTLFPKEKLKTLTIH